MSNITYPRPVRRALAVTAVGLVVGLGLAGFEAAQGPPAVPAPVPVTSTVPAAVGPGPGTVPACVLFGPAPIGCDGPAPAPVTLPAGVNP